MKGKRNSDYQKISRLIPLRITADLNVDEAKAVDEAVRYDDTSRSALEAYSRTLAVLQEAAACPVPGESSIVRGTGGSLWDRIEPRLGPAGRMRRGRFDVIPTRYLVAACVALVSFAAVRETGVVSLPGQTVHPRVMVAHHASGGEQGVGVPQGAWRGKVHIRWMLNEPTVIPEMGITVGRVDRLMQNQLGLPDMNGVLVGSVSPGTLGDKLRPFDCITAVNGRPVYAPRHLKEVLSECISQGDLRFDVIRRVPAAETSSPNPNDQSWVNPGSMPAAMRPVSEDALRKMIVEPARIT